MGSRRYFGGDGFTLQVHHTQEAARPRPGPSILSGGEYPPHLRHVSVTIDRLWDTGRLDALFPGGQDRVVLPWPRAGRLQDGRLFDVGAVEDEFRHEDPAVAHIDPRRVWASQPYVLRAGVDYYLKPIWFRTGRTWADQSSVFNRLPVVERREGGEDVILGGHHRFSAALLQGKAMLARCVTSPGRSVNHRRVAVVLPSVWVRQSDSNTDGGPIHGAVEAVLRGETAEVESHLAAQAIARRLRSIEGEAR